METNTQLRLSTSTVAVRYGLLTGIVSIIYSFTLIATGLITNSALGLLAFAIFVGGIILAQRTFRASNGGFMSYSEGLGIGVLVSLISGVLSTAFNYIYREFIDPGSVQRITDLMRAKLEEPGTLSDEQIDQTIALSQKLQTGPIGIVSGIVGAVVIGLILSLIISAIMKRTQPEFE